MEIIHVSSIADLETAIGGLDPSAGVQILVTGDPDVSEAAFIYRRLEILVLAGRARIEVDSQMMEALRRAADHYEELGALDVFLDLMRRDLQEGIPMRARRFDGVRTAVNGVVTTAPPSSSVMVLEDITIEAQKIARVARGLGFGGADVELASVTEDEILWLVSEAVGAGPEAPVIGDGGGAVVDGGHEAAEGADKKSRLPIEDAERDKGLLPIGDADGDKGVLPLGDADSDKGVLPLGDADSDKGVLPLGDADADKGLLPLGDADGDKDLLPLGDADGDKGDLPIGEADEIDKEQMVLTVLLQKIDKLRIVICAAMRAAFIYAA